MSLAKFGAGCAAGIVIGSIVGMSVANNRRASASMKKNVSRTLRTLGDMVNSYK
ncbi:MAG: hypothetical protein IKD89_05575 [Clostridia bacterium]|nr:hypothetical protein [Clostridia bacterium]